MNIKAILENLNESLDAKFWRGLTDKLEKEGMHRLSMIHSIGWDVGDNFHDAGIEIEFKDDTYYNVVDGMFREYSIIDNKLESLFDSIEENARGIKIKSRAPYIIGYKGTTLTFIESGVYYKQVKI